MSYIKPSTIDKHLIVFEEIKTICDSHGNLHIQKIIDNYKVSAAPFYASVKLNYFKKIDLEKYECLVGKFERTHIRKILEYTNNRYKNSLTNNRQTENIFEPIMKDKNIERVIPDFGLKIPSVIKEGNIIPPTFDMVEKYCNERKNDINPAKFISYYEQKGWKIGRDKMKDWKRAIHTWEQKN
jgi:hypothetical protein